MADFMATKEKKKKSKSPASDSMDILEKAFAYMATAKALTDIYEANFKEVSKYVHATSRGHEAV
ncbi:MAG TPA: hypothetical protein VN763_08040, partial [Saprospiraceae bacterium]|nr:hypothetical protein [Saprospiraceae bacterium]